MINLVGIADSSKHALKVLKKAENYCPPATLQQIHYLLQIIVISKCVSLLKYHFQLFRVYPLPEYLAEKTSRSAIQQ